MLLIIFTGCSKMFSCKAREVMRNKAYFSYAAMTDNERNVADERFRAACLHKQSSLPKPLTAIRKPKHFKHSAPLQPANHIPAAQGIILIHHNLKPLTI